MSIKNLRDSAAKGELVVVVGTGISSALADQADQRLSWKGLVADGFDEGVRRGSITTEQRDSWRNQLDSNDLDDLLAAAEFMGRKLGAPTGPLYARWLESTFKDLRPTNDALIKSLQRVGSQGVPFCTLNYDTLLEAVLSQSSITLRDVALLTSWMRRECNGVVHLHGLWQLPDTCILGIRDYETTLRDGVRDLVQRSLSSFRRLLFIGCGETLSDPNLSALTNWLRKSMGAATPQHYALVRNDEVPKRLADPSWQGFVEPVGYGAEHSDLADFLSNVFVQKRGRVRSIGTLRTSAPHATTIDTYRAFLLKDCGQMTIEGVRADMDTAQRKFDLERLFVPLKLSPCPPEFPNNDPEREQKLAAWHERHKEPISFGRAFAKHRRIALLALPGGGKTLLLKRLAVAYADPSRRRSSNDELPEIDALPVLIRCREWREHIRQPIIAILRNIAEITGQSALSGLDEALLPLLKNGRVLLMVDGLDEIHDDADRATFVENLERFLEDYKQVRIIITSREAGFGLVAPTISRFCSKWRIAPLEEAAIRSLCEHWHRLMIGDSPEALADGVEVASLLLRNASIRRLAENPLLLTMLLVVKHGAGRLPPDRVSLYERAVEVLLDTWNIKGHEALNLKEAVPQLACVAFQLMVEGKQTATEMELLKILEEAREKVPQIRRYAKDTPYAFLKRVELRSSLLLETGFQLEKGRIVPFYQFRHLTFQEYLAAVAAAEGHYLGYQENATVLEPLETHLSEGEWKEVVPMAAVLARKQAEPLIAALVRLSDAGLASAQSGETPEEWEDYPPKLPMHVQLLMQSLIEEAEAFPSTILATLRLIAFFARGCTTNDEWRTLVRGPFGNELIHQAWIQYSTLSWPQESWMRNTLARLVFLQKEPEHWFSDAGVKEILALLRSRTEEAVCQGLLVCLGALWSHRGPGFPPESVDTLINEIELHFFALSEPVHEAAAASWAFVRRHHKKFGEASKPSLARLLTLWVTSSNLRVVDTLTFAISTIRVRRNEWEPVFDSVTVDRIKRLALSDPHDEASSYDATAALVLAFYGRIWSDKELAATASKHTSANLSHQELIEWLLEQLGADGDRYLKRKRRPRRTLAAAKA